MHSNVPELLERCLRVATSTWSDALDRIGVPGVIRGLTLRCGAGRVAGTAVTVKETVGTLGAYPLEAFAIAKILDAVQPRTILAVDMDGAEASTMGGLAAQAAVQRGVAGVVINGGCRDVDDIRASGLWLSSRHVTPISGKTRVKVESINVPIRISGIPISPGDYVVGDETGVVCVSADRLFEVLKIAEELTARDVRIADALCQGDTFGSAAARIR